MSRDVGCIYSTYSGLFGPEYSTPERMHLGPHAAYVRAATKTAPEKAGWWGYGLWNEYIP